MTPPESSGSTPGARPADASGSPTVPEPAVAQTQPVAPEPVSGERIDSAGDDVQEPPASGAIVAEVLETPAVEGNENDTLVPLALRVVAVLAVAAVLLIAFVLPTVKGGPNHLPIGVAATPQIQTQAKQLFSQRYSNTFELKNYKDGPALRKAIGNRSVYGGLVVTQTEATMLTAQTASPRAANALNAVAQSLGLTATEVKPAPAKDPAGTGLAASGLPLALIGIFPALLLMAAFRERRLTQLGAMIVSAFLLGAGASALLTFWLGPTQGANFWLVSVAITAALLSTNLLLLGLNAVGGRIATGIGIAALVLVSVPLSGFSTGSEWLAQPWGDIGQLLPAGAGGTLLRNAAFFDGHAAGKPLLVLGVWALAGLLMLGLSEGLAQPSGDFALEPGSEAEPLTAGAGSLDDGI